MRKRLSTLLRSAVIGGTLVLLSGCGSRAGELDEKIARAEQAAQKAEAAQKAAELAAQKAVAFSKTSSMTQDSPSEAERDMDKASQDPNSAYFDNTIATPEG
ncbi:hypothetical protein OKA06_14985 [Novosphingobium sp. MW5]|nr:hypothetical protein [Novosphingobium sp. MW5]